MKIYKNPEKLKVYFEDSGDSMSLIEFCAQSLDVHYTDLFLVFEFEGDYYILDECGNYDTLPCEYCKIIEID